MTPELSNTLAALAQKLGTSVEHLWPMLVAKQRLDSIVVLIFCATASAALAFCAWKVYTHKYDEFNEEFKWIPVSLCGIFSMVALACAVGEISNIAFPEVAAIKSILVR